MFGTCQGTPGTVQGELGAVHLRWPPGVRTCKAPRRAAGANFSRFPRISQRPSCLQQVPEEEKGVLVKCQLWRRAECSGTWAFPLERRSGGNAVKGVFLAVSCDCLSLSPAAQCSPAGHGHRGVTHGDTHR